MCISPNAPSSSPSNVATFRRIRELQASANDNICDISYPKSSRPNLAKGRPRRLLRRVDKSIREIELTGPDQSSDAEDMECESEEEQGSDGSWESLSTDGSCDLDQDDEYEDDSDYEMVVASDTESSGAETDQLLSDEDVGTQSGTSASTISSSTYYYVSSPAFGQDTGRRGNPNVVINTVFDGGAEVEKPSHEADMTTGDPAPLYLTVNTGDVLPRTSALLGRATREYAEFNFVGPVTPVDGNSGSIPLP